MILICPDEFTVFMPPTNPALVPEDVRPLSPNQLVVEACVWHGGEFRPFPGTEQGCMYPQTLTLGQQKFVVFLVILGYLMDEVHQIFITITVMAGLRFLLFPPSFFLILSLSLLSTLRWSCGLVLLTGTPVGGANQFPDASLRTCSASTITSRI